MVPSGSVPDCLRWRRPLGGVQGRLLPPNGRVKPHNSTDGASFHTVLSSPVSLEAAGTRPLTKYSRTRKGLGDCGRSGSRAINARRGRAGSGLKLRPIYCGRDIMRFSSGFSGSAAPLASVSQRLISLPWGTLLIRIAGFKPAPRTTAERPSVAHGSQSRFG